MIVLMVDVYTAEKRSDIMRRIRSKDTGPELRVRKALHRLGFRYRLHDKRLPGKPDLVLPKYHAVVQVRGCYWHGHTCKDGHVPKSRSEYWAPKIKSNKERDARNDLCLSTAGWRVIVVWECECASEAKLRDTISRISAQLHSK